MIGLGSFLIAAAMVAPSFAAKKAVSDEELDMVTAAGQPVVVSAGTALTLSFNGTTTIASVLDPLSQNGLRALILNNVVGENQVHNGINVSAFGSADTISGAQINTITQSWGSVLDFDHVSADGATASATGPTQCVTGVLICKGTVTAQGGAGFARALSKGADVIIHAGTEATVTYNPVTSIAADISDTSQTNLIALVVNNVTGLNQVATGINITNNTLDVGVSSIALGAVGGIGGSQVNNINQFRGTPGNFRVGSP
jgi:hypothetical protein